MRCALFASETIDNLSEFNSFQTRKIMTFTTLFPIRVLMIPLVIILYSFSGDNKLFVEEAEIYNIPLYFYTLGLCLHKQGKKTQKYTA